MAKDFDYYLDLMKSNVSNLDTSEGSVVDGILRAAAYGFAAAQQDLQGFSAIAFPEDGSGEYLDARAADVGMSRKAGTKATAVVTFSGADGTVIPQGTAVQTAGGLVFLTIADATIADGSATAAVEAEAVGADYNVAADEIFTMQTATMATITASTAATGGADEESDADLLIRLQTFLRQSPASGNAAQYLVWATSVGGVGYAKVIPRPGGTLYAVKLALVDEDMLPVTAAKAAEVAAYLETVREVCVDVTAVPATSVTLAVAATVTLADGITADAVAERLTAELTDYCRTLARTGGAVVYHRIAYMLLGIPGVEDMTALTVNGDTENISLAADAVPVVGAVTIT